MENLYTVEVITTDNKKHTEKVKATDELEALDMVNAKYKNILDMKVVG